MKRESNSYTILYASIMVVVVAILLAFTSQALKDTQKKNEEVDKMMQILRSLRVEATALNAEAKFKELIKESYLIDRDGNRVEGDAFRTSIVEALRERKALPVFVANVNGEQKYVLSLYGAGLWGPIWGYVSLDNDKNTIFGADFSHEGETPGLGAEIVKPFFSTSFQGKKIFDVKGNFVSVAVVKPGKKAEDREYVDGVSGGTITSKGVDKMLYDSIGAYEKFLTSNN